MFRTFRELRDALNLLPDELLEMTASVYSPEHGEVVPISEVFIVTDATSSPALFTNGMTIRSSFGSVVYVCVCVCVCV